ncbi:MAG TPA: penicillin acylase family protein [Thermoanaerobaculia bacterium]|nr:penicillin acylase family protein [Thermoanaerobaculia bacterium]
MKRALVLAVLLSAVPAFAAEMPNGRFAKVAGMLQPGMITREANGIPHVFALNRHDLMFLNGWLHAQDRLFQMDTSRRIASGTLGELLGSSALSNDVQLRTFGLRRAAEAALPLLSTQARADLDAYAEGVNAYATTHFLPAEYGLLEQSKVPAWTAVDSLAVGKLIAFGLSFDLDLDPTVALISYQTVGKIVGFDGTKLFSDTWRVAPFTAAATIPDATGTGSKLPLDDGRELDTSFIKPETLDMLVELRNRVASVEVLAGAIEPERHAGSNEWAISPAKSTTGNALIANDPHLALSAPATFYPISLRGAGINVAGMGFPGAPFVIQGQNERIAWGSTVHPMDVTDLYQEQLVPEATSPSGFASIYKGAKENVQAIPQVFRVNVMGNGVQDDLAVVPASASIPQATLVVPRHGPVIQLNAATGAAVTVQYAGFYPTHELEAFMRIDEAKTIDEFKNALQLFDVGSQNFAVADVDGNIAYFTSGELPLREDLQAGKVTGVPPYFIRNGQGGNDWLPLTGTLPANQALPFQILPYAEMPQVQNPSNGWFVNANNDPTGQTLDNDPLNTPRAGGGILYLNPGYDGLRAGRITELVRAKLAGGGKMSPEDMKAIQADTALIDAEVFVPFITKAFGNAKVPGSAMAPLAASPLVAEAVDRLGKWNFTTPTGIDTGYDAADVNGVLSAPSQAEIDNSVAATVYAAWRSRFLANTIDAVMKQFTVPLPPAQQTLAALRFQLENYATTGGRGTSGVPFFNATGISDADTRRDVVILTSLIEGLAMLQSDGFAPAFNRSGKFTDWRWGKLHRVVFAHLMGSAFSPGGTAGQPPFPSAPPLTGVATDGGFGTVDAATHNARASTPDGFMFSSGPNRRYVGDMAKDGVRGESSLPGGVSGRIGDPFSVNLLMLWLTNDTFPVRADPAPKIPFLK